ncbi:MAG: CsgG/HfaB family protein [Pseudomonadota bacterium]
MKSGIRPLSMACAVSLLAGCATVPASPTKADAPVSRMAQEEAQKNLSVPPTKTLKRKVAIARFSNETRYGRSLLRDSDLDPLGKQASDMLANRLVASGNFLVFERPDIEKIKREQAVSSKADLIGVDTLIVGSVTEFGRSTTGKAGFLSSTKRQTAKAKVEVRLVDVKTGHVFFSTTGSGEASTESGEVAGFGSRADYDATLNDRAIAAAISDVLTGLITKMEERPWRTDILQINGNQVFISGGQHQGLKVGDTLAIMQEGKKVKSKQSGFEITLPATEVGSIRVVSLFGESETNEGAICELVAGTLTNYPLNELFVSEKKGKS